MISCPTSFGDANVESVFARSVATDLLGNFALSAGVNLQLSCVAYGEAIARDTLDLHSVDREKESPQLRGLLAPSLVPLT